MIKYTALFLCTSPRIIVIGKARSKPYHISVRAQCISTLTVTAQLQTDIYSNRVKPLRLLQFAQSRSFKCTSSYSMYFNSSLHFICIFPTNGFLNGYATHAHWLKCYEQRGKKLSKKKKNEVKWKRNIKWNDLFVVIN